MPFLRSADSEKENLTSLTYTTPTLLQLEFDFTLSHVTDEIVDDVRSFIRIAESTGGAIEYTGIKTTTEEYEYYELDSLKGIISLDLKRLAFENELSTFGTYDRFRLFERLYKAQQLGMKNVNTHGRKLLEENGFIGTVKKPLKVRLPLMSKRLMLCGGELNEVSYEELSDGESQLLQILAIIKLYSNENTLFLLDEPETHLNPAWRTMFHTYLTNALMGEGKETNSQVFVSTHSPFMVSSLKRSNVFLFSRKGKEEINFQPVQKETYGASFDVLIKGFFELRSLISQSVIDEIREQLKKGDAHAKEWIEDNLGLSAEKAYLIRKLSQ
ncbi:AAA family ATPase [Pseudoalteromonas sp. GB43]